MEEAIALEHCADEEGVGVAEDELGHAQRMQLQDGLGHPGLQTDGCHVLIDHTGRAAELEEVAHEPVHGVGPVLQVVVHLVEVRLHLAHQRGRVFPQRSGLLQGGQPLYDANHIGVGVLRGDGVVKVVDRYGRSEEKRTSKRRI